MFELLGAGALPDNALRLALAPRPYQKRDPVLASWILTQPLHTITTVIDIDGIVSKCDEVG